MDEKLKLELLELVSPESILPNLRLTMPFQEPLKSSLNNDDINQTDLHEDALSNQAPDDSITEPPFKKKPCISTEPSPVSETGSKYHGMRIRELRSRIQGDKVLEFCQEYGLIANKVTCSCGNQMRLRCRCGSDGFWWVCYRNCHGIKQNKSIRRGTWFEKSNLGISDILWLAYMWVHEYSYTSSLHECDHSNSTLLAWGTLCSEMCRKIVESKNNPIGGDARSVEIFDCEISEDIQLIEKVAFCAIEHNSTNSLHIIVDDKKSCTLRQIFQNYIRPGTKVFASNWSLFENMIKEDFVYLTKQLCISFTDLTTNEKMNTFEVFKMKTNMPNMALKYDLHFFENMYRKSLTYAPDAYLAYLKDIAMIYKPLDRYCTCLIEIVDYKSPSMKSQKCEIEHHVNSKLQ